MPTLPTRDPQGTGDDSAYITGQNILVDGGLRLPNVMEFEDELQD